MKYDKTIKTNEAHLEREENKMNPALIDILVEIGKLVISAIGEAVKENEQ